MRAVKTCTGCRRDLPKGGTRVPRKEIKNADQVLSPEEAYALLCDSCYAKAIERKEKP